MDPVTLTFLVIGGIALGILVLSLVLGDVLHFDADADGPLSLPAVAAFIGGLGFVGAIPVSLLDGSSTTTRVLAGIGVGIIAAIPLAWGAVRLTRGLMNMSTDRTLTEDDLTGALGTVISAIPNGGFGEVRIRVNGNVLKYAARSDEPLPAGTEILVISALSATAVDVVSTQS